MTLREMVRKYNITVFPSLYKAREGKYDSGWKATAIFNGYQYSEVSHSKESALSHLIARIEQIEKDAIIDLFANA